MTIFDDPNREVLGLDPIWSGADATDDDDGEVTPFDPAAHNVADVEAYVAEYPDERARVLAAEQAGKNRSSLVAALSEDDDGTG